jgi:hypothetical protein
MRRRVAAEALERGDDEVPSSRSSARPSSPGSHHIWVPTRRNLSSRSAPEDGVLEVARDLSDEFVESGQVFNRREAENRPCAAAGLREQSARSMESITGR